MSIDMGTDLGELNAEVNAAVQSLARDDISGRIWRKDHTVWKPDPTEITNRLGWLNVIEKMRDQAAALQSFARDVRDAGIRHVVLLGMGGSSLGAEVLKQTFGSAAGFPQLIVLDSILPESIQAVTEAIDPARTLFIVSSKSGTTIEPSILLRHFKSVTQRTRGDRFGQNFVAITDPGTPLESQAREEKFLRVFLNPTDIGGRYSVLSYYGLVPAALLGIDVGKLLDRAGKMRETCAPSVPAPQNPALWLGACMGALALRGRDKLTLLTSPSMGSFGLWAEQLIAESTGKESKGIIPVAGEPLLQPEYYGTDRVFVYLRVKDDDNNATDTAVRAFRDEGHPVVVIDVSDAYDLGAEFFRWEFATAVAGAVLGINPFDQPDVQKAKDATNRVLREYIKSGHIEKAVSPLAPAGLLRHASPGKYFAIMAYLQQTPATDEALDALRLKVMERYRIATTLGYGPRFLHSTGQLHKGGQNTGLFLQITAGHEHDVPVPGEPYSFGIVADAQALGDLQALQSAGRRVTAIRLEQADPDSLRRVAETIL